MSDSVAIVTGASRGLGRALAIGLARDGFKVAAMARSIDHLRSIAQEAGVPESSILPIKLDLADESSIVTAIRSVPRELGKLRVVVNNAGVAGPGTLGVNFDKFHSLLRINLEGPFRLLQEVVPIMLEGNEGLIINVASRSGKIGFAGLGAYGASKFGLVGLSESLYRELAPKGIKVTTLCPSWIDTDMAREGGTPLQSEQMIQPEDLMKTVRWLLSLSPAACVREILMECKDGIV